MVFIYFKEVNKTSSNFLRTNNKNILSSWPIQLVRYSPITGAISLTVTKSKPCYASSTSSGDFDPSSGLFCCDLRHHTTTSSSIVPLLSAAFPPANTHHLNGPAASLVSRAPVSAARFLAVFPASPNQWPRPLGPVLSTSHCPKSKRPSNHRPEEHWVP